MATYQSNREKMLNAVLLNDKLRKFGGYEPKDFATFDAALISENYVVQTVARIIQSHRDGNNPKSIYTEITDFLKKKV
jgi:hypothetical protein